MQRCSSDLDRLCLILAFCLGHPPCGVRASEVERNTIEEEEIVNACVCAGQYLDCEEITTSISSVYKQLEGLKGNAMWSCFSLTVSSSSSPLRHPSVQTYLCLLVHCWWNKTNFSLSPRFIFYSPFHHFSLSFINVATLRLGVFLAFHPAPSNPRHPVGRCLQTWGVAKEAPLCTCSSSRL